MECPICKVPLMYLRGFKTSKYISSNKIEKYLESSGFEWTCPKCGRTEELIKYILDKYNEYTLTEKIYGKKVDIDIGIDEYLNFRYFFNELEKFDEFKKYKSELESKRMCK